MLKPKRNLLLIMVPCALLAGWLAFGDSVVSQKAQSEQTTAEGAHGKDHLQQAADSLVAAAKERVAAAKTDDEAIMRARLSDQALSIIGKLGEFDTTPQSDELLDAFRTGGHPVIVDAVIQLRLANDLRQWEETPDKQHAVTIDRFVSDVKKTGITRGQAGMLYRASTMLGDGPDRKLAAKALQELLPVARDSKDIEINKMVPTYEGVLRRLDLLGKPLELEGSLVDGTKLDWNAYRGKVVLVDVFKNDCINCRKEVPNVLESYRAYHDKGFEVIGVNLDKNRQLAKQYMDQTGFHFPTLFSDDPKANGWDSPIATKYAIMQTPRAILVDQKGNVVSTSAMGETLATALEDLLGPADHPPARATSRSEDPSVTPAGGLPLGSGGVVPASAQEEVNPIEPAPLAPEPPK